MHAFWDFYLPSLLLWIMLIFLTLSFGIIDYAVVEKPSLETWMQGGLDYIMLKNLSIDGIRTIGSVLGQSIALDYYIRQVCGNLILHQNMFLGIWGIYNNFCFRLMEWLQNSQTSTVVWRKLVPSLCKEKNFSNLWGRQTPT